jgi:hypothetical protein
MKDVIGEVKRRSTTRADPEWRPACGELADPVQTLFFASQQR